MARRIILGGEIIQEIQLALEDLQKEGIPFDQLERYCENIRLKLHVKDIFISRQEIQRDLPEILAKMEPAGKK